METGAMTEPAEPAIRFGDTAEEALGSLVLGPCSSLFELREFIKLNRGLVPETVGRNLLQSARLPNGCLVGIEIDTLQNLNEWTYHKGIQPVHS